jgi:serine/threonine-protein kinase
MFAAILLPDAALAQNWGSIAYSPSSQTAGRSYNWPSQEDAEISALNYCGRSDCEYAISFQNACGAVAVGDNGGWAGGWDYDDASAQLAAIANCSAYDVGCDVVSWQCSW